MCQKRNKESMGRRRENESAADTQLCQQRNKDSTERSRDYETSEKTLQRQNDSKATTRSKENESSEIKTLRHQCDWQQQGQRNRIMVIQQQNMLNMSGNPFSNQYNPNSNDESELIKQFFTEYKKGIIPPSETRECGHTLNSDPENDETFNPCNHCWALRFRKIP